MPTLHRKAVIEMINDMTRRKRAHFDYAIVASCFYNPSLNGKSIEQINIDAGRPSTIQNEIETILDIVKMGSADMVFHSMSEADVGNILKYPLTMGLYPIRASGSFGVRRAPSAWLWQQCPGTGCICP